jgi:hypothetical protein
MGFALLVSTEDLTRSHPFYGEAILLMINYAY